MNSMNTADAALQTLRGEVIDIVLGTLFLTIGATACAIAAIRWRKGGPIGRSHPRLVGNLERDARPPKTGPDARGGGGSAARPQVCHSYVSTAVMYLLLVSALFAWRELSLGKLRLLLHLEILAGVTIALAGIGTFVLGGPAHKWKF